jgi:Protein of unknown function (DUF3040)
VTSMNAREQQALDSIRDGLASSDPTLAARLAMFTRLASGEEMPAREKVQADRGRTGGHARRMNLRLSLQQAAVLLWLVITMALIAVALAVSRDGSQATSAGPWATFCTGGTSAPKSVAGP